MAQEIKARIQLKHETEQVWKNTTNFIPMIGEMIVYDVDDNHSYERFKIGDGVRNVNELPFNEPNWNAVGGESGYILNKPNFLEEKIFFEEAQFQKAYDEQFGEGWVYQGNNVKYPTVGKSYIIVYNDIPYNCTCEIAPVGIVNDPDAVIMGNFSVIGRPDTGEPFVMLFSELNTNILVLDLIESNSVKIKIYEQQIKTNIIPDMYYTEESKILLEYSGDSIVSFVYGDSPLNLDPTITYKVIWNGDEYKCKPGIAIFNNEITAQYLGDIYTYSQGEYGTSPTGEPFALINYSGSENIIAEIIQASNDPYTIIILQDEIIHKIDTKYLPNSVPVAEKIVLLENTVAEVFEGSGWDNSYIIRKKIQPIVGKRYVINFNGVPYECECKPAPTELGLASDAVVMGNFSVIGGPDTGEPFALMISNFEQMIAILNLSESSSVYLEIYENKIQKLNEKCLPDGYPYISSGIIVEETVAIDEESGEGFITEKFNLIKDESYTVNWNGVEYSCIAKDFTLGDVLETIALGNIAALDGSGEPTDEPFIILYLSEALQSQFSAYGLLMALDGSTEVALSISGKIVHKMNKDLLPEIGMLNIKDGDNGSIRGTFTMGAIGSMATAIGYQTMALGECSYAEGYSDYNIQDNITTETTLEEILEERKNGNYFTLAFGQASHAEGYNTLAYGEYSHAEGYSTIASGSNSHAEGTDTKAYGDYSHAEGYSTAVFGNYSHAEGWDTLASGERSHAEGSRTIASGDYQHVQGKYNKQDNTSIYAHIVGNGSSDSARSNAHTLDWAGNAWFAGNIKIGGTDQNDENAKILATTDYVDNQIAAIPTSEVVKTTVQTLTDEQKAQARTNIGAGEPIIDVVELPTENINEKAIYRLLTGTWLWEQFVQNDLICHMVEILPEVGEPVTTDMTIITTYYNVSDGICYGYVDSNSSSLLDVAVGWHPVDALFPALGYIYGGVVTSIEDASEIDPVYLLLEGVLYSYKDGWSAIKIIGKPGTGANAEVFNHPSNKASGNCSHAEGSFSHAEGWGSHAEGDGSHAEGDGSHAEGWSSHAEGCNSHAEGEYSHAEEWSSHAEGCSSHAEGYCSHAEGEYSHAEGEGSHAEGWGSHAEGDGSHAEGCNSHAEGCSSHAEGEGYVRHITIAGDANATVYTVSSVSGLIVGASVTYAINNGTYNTAKIIAIDANNLTITVNRTLSDDTALSNEYVEVYVAGLALGDKSHSEGDGTIAAGRSQHTQGEFNIIDPNYNVNDNSIRGKYAHIVGNGEAEDARSNAHTIDWSGNAWFAGDVYVGSISGTNKDEGSKKLVAAPNDIYSGDLLMYNGTTFVKLSKADLIAEIIALLPRAEGANF